MKRLTTGLLLLVLCCSSLRAESWAGLALVGRLFIVVLAVLPIPFVLLAAWLLATKNRSIPLGVLALSGAVITIGATLWLPLIGWPSLVWAAAWLGIGFFTFRSTNSRPLLLGAGLTLASSLCAWILAPYASFGAPRMIH